MRKTSFLNHLRFAILASLITAAGGGLWGQSEMPTGEVNLFGGVSRFFAYPDKDHDPYRLNLTDGYLVGIRGTWNLASQFALEGGYSYGWNNIKFRPTPGAPANYGFVGFGSNTQIASLSPVIYLTRPRAFRMFAKAGIAEFIFQPTDDAEAQANSARYKFLNVGNVDTQSKTGALYGIGIKGYYHHKFGFRADIEGSVFGQPHLRVPTYPAGPGASYVPSGGLGTLYQVTVGFVFGFGGNRPVPLPPPPPPVVTPPPPPPPKPEPELTVNAAGVRTVDGGCPADTHDTIPLSVTAATTLPGHRPAYRWTVNGQPVGDNSPQYRFTVPSTAGVYRVAVSVSDDAAQSEDSRTAAAASRDMLMVTVRAYNPPTISGSATPTEIPAGDRATFTVTPRGDECNRQLTYTCTTDQGTLSGTPPNVFDSTGMAFDQADRSRPQSRVATISCTVRDASGGTATATIPVTVALAPLAAQRLDDIIFSQNNSRVNNCGKRILLEELYPQLTQHPDWDLVLVGHTAPDDAAGRPLDRQRAMNAAATVSAGADTCPLLESSRIRIALGGADQKSDTKPGFCGTSARNASTERAGQTLTGDDPNAKFRRVEVYLVPKGAAVPDAATRLQVVPPAELKALGCPR